MFGYRSCNHVAHELAALGCNLPSGVQTAWDALPHELEALVSSEAAATIEHGKSFASQKKLRKD